MFLFLNFLHILLKSNVVLFSNVFISAHYLSGPVLMDTGTKMNKTRSISGRSCYVSGTPNTTAFLGRWPNATTVSTRLQEHRDGKSGKAS